MDHSGYQRHIFNGAQFKARVEAVSQRVRELNPDFVACRGLSGISVASAVSYVTGTPMAVVRKPGENPHSEGLVNGPYGMKGRYVIIDDFISSGDTVDDIMEAVDSDSKENKCIGIILYSRSMNSTYNSTHNSKYTFSNIPTYGVGSIL